MSLDSLIETLQELTRELTDLEQKLTILMAEEKSEKRDPVEV
jgi:hypothetical protein